MGYGGIIGQTGVSGEYLPLTGGTMNGNIDMNGNQIINVQKITRTGVGYLNLESDSNINLNPGSGIISVNNARIQGLTLPNLGTDAANKAYVDSKASNWVKAATHSQYDEWHLAVEGGTFVKLVANTEINLEYDTYGTTGYRTMTNSFSNPNLRPNVISSTGSQRDIEYLVTFVMNDYTIIIMKSMVGYNINFQGYAIPHFYITANVFAARDGDETETLFKKIYPGQTISEYFVPA